MDNPYPKIPGTVPVPYDVLPVVSSDDASALPTALTNPPPPSRGAKTIFAFWHSGIKTMPGYLLRNVISWYRRFGPLGWTIYVIDNVPDSPLNMANFIDVTDPTVVPAALIEGKIGGSYKAQVMSDFSRFPLLLKYGGIYLDAGVLQFGDINWVWENHISNPDSPYEYAGMTMGDPPEGVTIINFNMMTGPDNPMMLRAHKILMKLWEGKTSTAGMSRSELVAHVPLLHVSGEVAVSEEGKGKMEIDDESMTDYAIQIQCLGAAQRWKDEDGGWDGPEYVKKHCWLYSMVDMAYANEQITSWNSKRQHELFLTPLPTKATGNEEPETEDQKLAREMVEACIGRSWCIKLAHGFSAKLFGAPTLGMLWRDNRGSDCAEGTHGAWLRWAETNLTHEIVPSPLAIPAFAATRAASLESMLK